MRDPAQVDGLKRMEGESRNERYASRRKYGPRQADRKKALYKTGLRYYRENGMRKNAEICWFTGNGIYVERVENEDFGRGK
jgi:hypothetical protein